MKKNVVKKKERHLSFFGDRVGGKKSDAVTGEGGKRKGRTQFCREKERKKIQKRGMVVMPQGRGGKKKRASLAWRCSPKKRRKEGSKTSRQEKKRGGFFSFFSLVAMGRGEKTRGRTSRSEEGGKGGGGRGKEIAILSSFIFIPMFDVRKEKKKQRMVEEEEDISLMRLKGTRRGGKTFLLCLSHGLEQGKKRMPSREKEHPIRPNRGRGRRACRWCGGARKEEKKTMPKKGGGEGGKGGGTPISALLR